MDDLIKDVIAEIRANPHKYPSFARQMVARLVRIEAALQEIIGADGTPEAPKHVSRSAIIQIAKNALAP